MNKWLKVAFLGAAALVLVGCTDADGARRTLEQSGYSDIEIGGYSFFGCSEDDFYATSFKATGPTGLQATGQVCSGMFLKGSTIRLD